MILFVLLPLVLGFFFGGHGTKKGQTQVNIEDEEAEERVIGASPHLPHHDSDHPDGYDDPFHAGRRDLVWHEDRLVFSEIKSETRKVKGHSPLYPVKVNLDIEALDSAQGVSMLFDRQAHSMLLQEGLLRGSAMAWGHYVDEIDKHGWSELYVDTSDSKSLSNDVTMYAAGYIEGILTCIRMSQFYANNHILLIKDEVTHHALGSLKTLFQDEINYLKAKSNILPHLLAREPDDAYWKQARYLLFQLWGLLDGYNYAAAHFKVHTLSLLDMILLNSNAEIQDMMEAYAPLALSDRTQAQMPPTTGVMPSINGLAMLEKLQRTTKQKRRKLRGGFSADSTLSSSVSHNNNTRTDTSSSPPDDDPLSDQAWEKRLQRDGHCSAFIRVTAGDADLLVGHTTWNDYSEMTRIFKYYNFPLPGAGTASTLVAMSSYPGIITSTDDFYMMDSGLVVMDTTIEVLDVSLFDKVQDFPAAPHIPNFVHIMASNRLAKTASHWAELFQTAINTGTYNAQWLVVDYNNFVPHKPVADNTLWVLETIPGAMHAEDLTHILRKDRYWASFNRPYFDTIREESGHAAAERSHGQMYSWHDNPRAKIFRASSEGIESLFEIRGLMTRNMYPYTPVVPIEPGHEISARMDLSRAQPIPNGGIDAKVVNRCLFKLRHCQAISSPSHASQKPFSWKIDGKEVFPGWPHIGLPDLWAFDFVQMTPTTALFPISDIIDCD